MGKRKRTPDILGELLGDTAEALESGPEEAEGGQPAVRTVRPQAGEGDPGGGTAAEGAEGSRGQAETALPQSAGGVEAADAAPPTDEPGPDHFVRFRLGGRHYALRLEHVERALRMVAVTPVPEAPSWMTGAIDVQGQVIPVLNVRERFGLRSREPDPDDRLLVVQAAGQKAALWVDDVTEVLEVPGHQVEPPPKPAPPSHSLTAVVQRDGELILVLNPAWLILSGERLPAGRKHEPPGESRQSGDE